jgi:hypothetical protein
VDAKSDTRAKYLVADPVEPTLESIALALGQVRQETTGMGKIVEDMRGALLVIKEDQACVKEDQSHLAKTFEKFTDLMLHVYQRQTLIDVRLLKLEAENIRRNGSEHPEEVG